MGYLLVIDPIAMQDVQQAIDFYDQQQEGLGMKFERELNQNLIILETNPHFSIRYDNVHCLPLKIFPYMVHFTVDENSKTVTIRAILHTAINPQVWRKA
jgi:toxin ParE1/3/4